MSVLNFPRIYFNGHMFWNPPTANNNDVLPLYDAVKMQMNWPFLSHYDINDRNAPSLLMPWTIAPLPFENLPDYVKQVPGNGNPDNYPMIPAEWDLFGDNACGTVDYKQTRSVIIGGELQANSYVDSDALINQGYQLLGNPFGSTAPTPARFVDISPWQNTFTALYFDKMVMGDTHCGLELKRQYRMLDRFLNFNWGAFGGLNYVTTTWQTCFPKDNLKWYLGDSQLLKILHDEMTKQNAKGLMFRFSTYLTFYDKNGVFNDYPPVNTRSNTPEALAALQKMYQQGLDNVADIFYNPAYSRTAGTLGLWFDNEYPTAPAGQRLAAKEAVSFFKAIPGDSLINPPTGDQFVKLGVLSAEVHGSTLSLDLGNTFPFYPVGDDPLVPPDVVKLNQGVPVAGKFNVGSYDLGINVTGGSFQKLASFGFEQYRQSAFDKRAGLLDLTLDANALKQLQQPGSLELRQQGTGKVAAAQQLWTAEVIESGSFIDVGDSLTLNIMVQCNGQPAPAGTQLLVAEYNNAFMLSTSDYYLAFSNAANFVLIEDYPSNRKKNQQATPNFKGGKPSLSLLREGSGRNLSALLSSKVKTQQDPSDPVMVPILYQDYLKTPAAVNLRPCLLLADAQTKSGTLEDKLGANIEYSQTCIHTNAQGIAQISVRAVAPGFPTLRFFLQDNSGQPPQIPFSFNFNQAYTDFLAPLRVLPQEPQMLKDFIDCWNRVCQYDDSNLRIWREFIFPRILQPFYYLYPIMNKFMPLNSLQRIEGAISQFIVLISKDYQEESTLAMPITRDLSQTRRRVLEIWATDLVSQGYPPTELKPSDYIKG
ncbi:hypothetical protein J4P02_28200 [Pseudomonas sp. NFXW11]|uniref:hypothetical protein n=1 Tax=Pseudomonas sp. NFXW11 TaxID=2819531 RepID=UPI003CF364DB